MIMKGKKAMLAVLLLAFSSCMDCQSSDSMFKMHYGTKEEYLKDTPHVQVSKQINKQDDVDSSMPTFVTKINTPRNLGRRIYQKSLVKKLDMPMYVQEPIRGNFPMKEPNSESAKMFKNSRMSVDGPKRAYGFQGAMPTTPKISNDEMVTGGKSIRNRHAGMAEMMNKQITKRPKFIQDGYTHPSLNQKIGNSNEDMSGKDNTTSFNSELRLHVPYRNKSKHSMQADNPKFRPFYQWRSTASKYLHKPKTITPIEFQRITKRPIVLTYPPFTLDYKKDTTYPKVTKYRSHNSRENIRYGYMDVTTPTPVMTTPEPITKKEQNVDKSLKSEHYARENNRYGYMDVTTPTPVMTTTSPVTKKEENIDKSLKSEYYMEHVDEENEKSIEIHDAVTKEIEKNIKPLIIPTPVLELTSKNKNKVEERIPQCASGHNKYCELTENYPWGLVTLSLENMNGLHTEMNNRSNDYEIDLINRRYRHHYSSSGSHIDRMVCESNSWIVRPGWAKNAVSKQWMIIINSQDFKQFVRVEECINPKESCSFIEPFYSSVCEQKYSLHKLFAIDWKNGMEMSKNELKPRLHQFMFPSGCSCRVLNLNHK